MNTLLKEKELNGQLYDYMDRYYQHGLDAAIVQDFGVFSFLRKEFPNLPLHISTQMTITGPYGAGFMERQGASRVVLARELSLKEIEEIRKNVNLELEVFVHGAICYCYSGQCLFSSILGGRSGNRGRCAQPCRLPYEVTAGGKRISGLNEPYVMNLKDMCALELLPKLLKAGVNSLKMEGRMKSPTYTAGVTELYRKYTDLYYEKGEHGYLVEPEDLKTVSKLFDRGGYTKRYFFEHNGMDMIAPGKKPKIRETDSELLKGIMERQKERERTDIRPVWGRVVLKQTAPVRLCFTDVKSGVFSETEGSICQEAKSRPLTEEAVRRQLTKTGGTGFHLEKLEIETDGNVFLPVQSLNELRRDGISSLKEAFFAPYM